MKGHRSWSKRRASSSTTTRKNAEKKSQVFELGQANPCAYLTDFPIKFWIQHKNRFCRGKKAGLGLKKIEFDLENTEEIYAKLTSSELYEDQNTIGFPQLKNCGGFELLRCVSNCRVLESIEYAMAIKTGKTSVGQGKIYIRPI